MPVTPRNRNKEKSKVDGMKLKTVKKKKPVKRKKRIT
jgi:hypothetical protein